MTGKIVGFHHPGLVVPDLEQARTFYCEVFEFEVLKYIGWDGTEVEWPDKIIGLPNSVAKGVQLKGKNGFLELFEYQQPPPTDNPAQRQASDFGIRHLAFQVIDIQAIYDRFLAAGGTSHSKPFPVGQAIALYCRDPFGNIIELLEFIEDKAGFDLYYQKLLR